MEKITGYISVDSRDKKNFIIPSWRIFNCRNDVEILERNLILYTGSTFYASNLKVIYGNIVLCGRTFLSLPNLELITGTITSDHSDIFIAPKLFKNFNEKYFKDEYQENYR